MAYDTTYSFDSLAANSGDFTFVGPDHTGLQVRDTDGGWCWTSTGSVSSSTGPPSGTACVYTETSSPVAVSDEFTMTLATANEVDASAYLLYVTFDVCLYGNTSGHAYFEAFDGTDWNSIDDWALSSTSTMQSQGPYNFTAYDNDDFSIRFRSVVGGTTYQNDFAVDEVRIYGEDADVTPVITDAGDEDFVLGETNIVVTGTDFIATQGTGDLELGDSATYGSATLVSQSIDTWSDTSIQFDLTIGTLDQEQLWLYVTNSDSNVSNAYEVHVEMTPTITDAGDEVFETDETNITMTGTNFLATQSTGKLELVNNSVYASGTKVTQSIDTWADTSIQFDLAIGAFTEVDLWLFATNSLGHVSTGYPVEIIRTPTITNIEDEDIANNEQNVVLDGTYLLDAQGTGKLELADGSTYATATKVTQSIDTWDNTEIVFDVVKGGFSEGTYYFFVTNDFGEVSTAYEITLTAPPPETLYKTTNLQFSITSAGIDTTVFLIADE